MRTLSALFVAAILLCSCESKKQITATSGLEYFILGSGGGFTGKYDEYKVYADGRIEKMNFEDEATYEAYATVDKKELVAFFNELEELQVQDLEYDHPGNMTWYIEVQNGSSPQRIKWGDYKAPPIDPKIEAYFKKVHDYILGLKKDQ